MDRVRRAGRPCKREYVLARIARADITRSFNLHNPIVEGTVNQKAFAALVARGRDEGGERQSYGGTKPPVGETKRDREGTRGQRERGNAGDKKKAKR